MALWMKLLHGNHLTHAWSSKTLCIMSRHAYFSILSKKPKTPTIPQNPPNSFFFSLLFFPITLHCLFLFTLRDCCAPMMSLSQHQPTIHVPHMRTLTINTYPKTTQNQILFFVFPSCPFSPLFNLSSTINLLMVITLLWLWALQQTIFIHQYCYTIQHDIFLTYQMVSHK